LETDDFTLEVPAGAFAEATTLELHLATEEFPEDSALASRLFRIDGLPAQYNAPLTVSFGITGEDEGEPLVVTGEDVYIKSSNENGPSWIPLEAEVTDGRIVTTLPVPEVSEKARNDYEYFSLPLGATFYYSMIDTDVGHFRIYFPTGMSEHAIHLGICLEEAYTKFQTMGFDYSARTRWPVRAIVLKMPDHRFGETVPSRWGHNYGSLRFSTRKLPEHDVMRLTAGHEFFHLIQAYYDPRGPIDRARIKSVHLWVDEATATWSEELFTETANYVPSIRHGQVMEPYEGLQAGIIPDAADHGYGMSALFKALVDAENDPSIVKETYEHIRSGEHPARAIELAADAPYEDWWNEFMVEYFSGYVYGELEIEHMIGGHSGSFSIETDDDTLWTVEKNSAALSGRIYKVILGNPTLDEGSYADFTLSGNEDQRLSVFSYHSTAGAELLGTAPPHSVVVADLKTLREQGKALIALVTNPRAEAPGYYATTLHNLKVEITPGIPILEAMRRGSRISYGTSPGAGLHTFRYTDPDTTYLFEEHNFPNMGGEGMPGDFFPGPYPALSVSGAGFSAELDYSIWRWDIIGTFNPADSSLTYLGATGQAVDGDDDTLLNFEFFNLPMTSSVIEDDQCTLSWARRDGGLDQIRYVRTRPFYHNDEIVGEVTIEYLSSEWSLLLPRFGFYQVAP